MNVVDAYLETLNEPHKSAIINIRQIVRKISPMAEEVITYGMPGFKYKGKYLISFSVFKDHMSIFPGPKAIQAHYKELQSFKCSKGTIQFTAEHQIPAEILKSIITHRINDIDAKL